MSEQMKNTLAMLQQLDDGVQKRYNALEELQRTPVRQGFLNEGQGVGDFFKRSEDPSNRPTGTQNRAMMAMAQGIDNRDRGKGGIGGISAGYGRGLDLMDEMRARQKDTNLKTGAIGLRGATDKRDHMMDMLKMLPEEATTDTSWQTVGGDRILVNDTTGEEIHNAGPVSTAPNEEAFGQEEKLRDEFQSLTKDYRAQQEAFGRVQASVKSPTPAGDLSLIFNYMKLLDPGSVVRESEFATAASAGSYGERVKAMVAQIRRGERLSPAMRRDFMKRSSMLYEKASEGYEFRQKQYQGLSTQYGLNPGNVVTSNSQYTPADYGALTAELPDGYVEGDYAYHIGNDPANPNDPASPASWSKNQ